MSGRFEMMGEIQSKNIRNLLFLVLVEQNVLYLLGIALYRPQASATGAAKLRLFAGHTRNGKKRPKRANALINAIHNMFQLQVLQIKNTPGEHAEVVHSTLNALVEDVNKTTELIRRRREEQLLEKKTFQSEMEVNGRITVDPNEDWLNLRLKSVSTDDLKNELGKLKGDQSKFCADFNSLF